MAIPKKWSNGDDGVWQVDLTGIGPEGWPFRQLFVDGKRAIRARSPNADAPNPFLYATGGDKDHAIIDPALVKEAWGLARDAQINIVPEFVGLPLNQTTLAERLKALGYTTGLVGKWHLGELPKFSPLKRGFDEFWGYLAGSHDYFRADPGGEKQMTGPILCNYKEPQPLYRARRRHPGADVFQVACDPACGHDEG